VNKNGYYTDPSRKCRFSVDYVTPGAQGLAWAILLKAIEDGCSEDWLRDIIRYYGINFDEDLLSRLPANKVKLNNQTNQMMGFRFTHVQTPRKPLLSMEDGLHIKGLTKVATEE